MGKKLLVATGIVGAAAVTGYLLRDRIIAAGLDFAGNVNQFVKDAGERDLELNGDGADFVAAYTKKENS